MATVSAIHLRNPLQLAAVPSDKPGWYRWWAPEEALMLLLGDHYHVLSPHLTKGQGKLAGLSCVYVGVAVKESIRSRLDWHVNQKHTHSCIKCGALSTLRQTISSLVGHSQGDETATNRLIDQLMIEYFPVDMPLRSREAKEFVDQAENGEMHAKVLPLNIRHNHQPAIAEFKKSLKAARKAAKLHYLLGGYK